MDPKKTILIAVMVNASLLALLFLGALSSQEGIENDSSPSIAQTNSPLFSGETDMTPQRETAPLIALEGSLAPIAQTAVHQEPVVETPPLHKLPPPVEPQAVAAVPVAAAPTPAEVVVKKGDSLEKIAKVHHTTADAIIKLNHLPGSFLKVGQVLKIPPKTIADNTAHPVAVQEKQTPAGVEYYTVKVGDSPWSIAMKHHMKVEELLKLNGMSEENAKKLKPGNRLRIR